MTLTSFVFTELANIMKFGGWVLYNLVFTEWRHCVSQSEVWGRGCYITLFSPTDVAAFHRIAILVCTIRSPLFQTRTRTDRGVVAMRRTGWLVHACYRCSRLCKDSRKVNRSYLLSWHLNYVRPSHQGDSLQQGLATPLAPVGHLPQQG